MWSNGSSPALEAGWFWFESRCRSTARVAQWESTSLVRKRPRVRDPVRAPCDCSVSGQHATLPRLQGRFESGQSLASRTSPIGRGVPFRAGRFAVRVRGSVRKVNRPGGRARPLSDARGHSVAFKSPAFLRGRCAAGAASGPENRRRGNPRGSTPPSSSSMATAHPVVGAALIRRYSSVRLRGGQPGAS